MLWVEGALMPAHVEAQHPPCLLSSTGGHQSDCMPDGKRRCRFQEVDLILVCSEQCVFRERDGSFMDSPSASVSFVFATELVSRSRRIFPCFLSILEVLITIKQNRRCPGTAIV